MLITDSRARIQIKVKCKAKVLRSIDISGSIGSSQPVIVLSCAAAMVGLETQKACRKQYHYPLRASGRMNVEAEEPYALFCFNLQLTTDKG